MHFRVGDILELPAEPEFDGILCRGVLNDMVDDGSRQAAFDAFAGALRSEGILVLDVREWSSSALRKANDPIFGRIVETDTGTLVLQSVSRLYHEQRQLLISERHTFNQGDGAIVTEYDFVMRCWTKDELHRGLDRAGFTTSFFGAYEQGKLLGSTDRIVAVSVLGC